MPFGYRVVNRIAKKATTLSTKKAIQRKASTMKGGIASSHFTAQSHRLRSVSSRPSSRTGEDGCALIAHALLHVASRSRPPSGLCQSCCQSASAEPRPDLPHAPAELVHRQLGIEQRALGHVTHEA